VGEIVLAVALELESDGGGELSDIGLIPCQELPGIPGERLADRFQVIRLSVAGDPGGIVLVEAEGDDLEVPAGFQQVELAQRLRQAGQEQRAGMRAAQVDRRDDRRLVDEIFEVDAFAGFIGEYGISGYILANFSSSATSAREAAAPWLWLREECGSVSSRRKTKNSIRMEILTDPLVVIDKRVCDACRMNTCLRIA
jgi:hypothetical protein